MAEKIVLVTAGGAISSFHAGMKEMHEVLAAKAPGRFELWGAIGGLQGLMNGDLAPIHYEDIDEDQAGSLIGTDREIADTLKILEVIKQKDIYAIVMMGGNNHLGEAAKLFKDARLNIVGYPKTMDFDLSSLVTLGYNTAVTVGAKATRNHHKTAMTKGGIFYVGLFGRDTDWVPCAVSLYGGADRCIPCEQKYEWDYVWEKINSSIEKNKEKYGKAFAVVAFSEGAKINAVNEPPEEHRRYDKHHEPKLQSEWIAMELERLTIKRGWPAAKECHTYSEVDSPPTETDKKLSKMAGRECIEMILEGDFGKAAVFKPHEDFYRVDRAPLEIVAVQRRLKPTGFFDYEELMPRETFQEVYGNLFRDSLGEPPNKDALVYRNMLRKA